MTEPDHEQAEQALEKIRELFGEEWERAEDWDEPPERNPQE